MVSHQKEAPQVSTNYRMEGSSYSQPEVPLRHPRYIY